MYIDFSETFDTYIPSLSLAFQPANLNENSSTISITPALADFANNLNKENQIQKYENSQTGIKRVSLTEDRRRYRDIKECIDIIIKVSKDNQLYAAAMLAVLLAGMRRHEIPDTEIFVPYNHKSIDLLIPTLKQRRETVPRRAISYSWNSEGGHILYGIHKSFGEPFSYQPNNMWEAFGLKCEWSKPFAGISVQGLANSIRKHRPENDENFTLHTLRHRFASDMRKIGMNQSIIQRSMGHRDPRSTSHYGEILY